MNFYEHTIIAIQDTSPAELKQLTEKYSKIVEKNEAIDKKLLRHLTVKVKKLELETNYFSKKEESETYEKRGKTRN